MMEVKKSEYLHMKMERKNGGDKKEIYTYETFYNCPQIRTVRLPESVDKIALKAFVSCKKMSNVYFLSKLQDIGDDVLFQCGGK